MAAWDAAKVEAALRDATRVVKLWSAGQRAPNHCQRRQVTGSSPDQRARRARLVPPSPEELAKAEAFLACLATIADERLRRLVRARVVPTSWARLQAIDGRDRRIIKTLVTRELARLAAAIEAQERERGSVHAAA